MSHATVMPPAPGTPVSLSDLDVDLLIESFVARWVNPNTRNAYRADLVLWQRWCADRNLHPVTGVRRGHVEMFMRWCADERHNSANTINHRVGTLSRFFEICIDDDLVWKNPCRNVIKIRVPRRDPTRRRHLTLPELDQLLSHTETATCPTAATDHALIMLMAYCGLRVSEACSLDIADTQVRDKGHRCVRFTGKGSLPATVPIPPPVAEAVDAAIGDRTEGPVLLRRDGTRMTRRSADRVVKRCAKAAGITAVAVHPHMFRATMITLALDARVDLDTVRRSARHADISTTLLYDRDRVTLSQHAAYTIATLREAG